MRWYNWLVEYAMYRDDLEAEVMTPVPPSPGNKAQYKLERWLLGELGFGDDLRFRRESNPSSSFRDRETKTPTYLVIPTSQWLDRFHADWLLPTPRPLDEAIYEEIPRPLQAEPARAKGILHQGGKVVRGRPVACVEASYDGDYYDEDDEDAKEPIERTEERRLEGLRDLEADFGLNLPDGWLETARPKAREAWRKVGPDVAVAKAMAAQGFDSVIDAGELSLPRLRLFWPGSTCVSCEKRPSRCGRRPRSAVVEHPDDLARRRLDALAAKKKHDERNRRFARLREEREHPNHRLNCQVMSINRGRQPDWQAARAEIATRVAGPISAWPKEAKFEGKRPADGSVKASKIREGLEALLLKDLEAVSAGWRGMSREFWSVDLGDRMVLITGAIASPESSPTAGFESVIRLETFGISKAAGFDD